MFHKRILTLLYLCGSIFMLHACSDSKDEPSLVDEFYIKPSKSDVDFERLSSEQKIDIETNVKQLKVEVLESGKGWCTANLSGNVLTITTTTNTGADVRKTMVNLSGDKISKNVIINQKGLGASTGTVEDDILIKAANASTNSAQSGEGIEKSIDGDLTTIYHSRWDASVPFPIELTYNFKDVPSMDYIIYHPRQGGSNGNFKEIEVWYATESNPSLKKYDSFDFKGRSVASRITFTPALEKPTKISFVVKSGNGDNNIGFASCAEMEFYRVNPNNFDYTQIFADAACTKIKSGLSRTDLENISNTFFRELALEIFDNKYDSEFRVQEYKAYQSPWIMAAKNKTSQYSLRDNPTGIYVNTGEELIVFADDLKGQNVSLLVQDLNHGFGGASYPLVKGQNKVKVSRGGLVYVMYHTDGATKSPVKIHIVTGTVNGYYDSQKHTKEDWSRLLSKASYKEFDVLGKYAHLTFATSEFRSYTPDGKKLIDAYDRLVELEWEFMGLFKYNRTFSNRMYFHVVYDDSYMYATDNRTAYHYGTLKELCDVTLFSTSSIWGPAHEVGHVNQTRPGLKWIGMTEVTNNIHSLYVQTSFGNIARIMDGTYEKAIKAIVDAKIAHNDEPDVFFKLVPFWQLKLYMEDALGITDFYKDIYEKVRVNENPANDGLCQLQFVKFACEAARLDLTEFFEQWGFLTPIDKTIDDYSKAHFLITQSQIDQLKSEIAAKAYPKPKHSNIYLIKDDNVNSYK